MITTEIVTYCAEEVERQRRGPVQVGWMVEAWEYALDHRAFSKPELEHIQYIAYVIERNKNHRSKWRNCGVSVGDHIPPPARELGHLMERWYYMLKQGHMTPEEAYKEFELIHPFLDGNGRVGKIIFNWLKGTLDKPIMPPNFFGGGNP